jgi:hypothetical protein
MKMTSQPSYMLFYLKFLFFYGYTFGDIISMCNLSED